MTSLTGFFSHSVRDPVPISLAEKCRLCFVRSHLFLRLTVGGMPRGLLFIFQYRRNRKVDHSCFEDNAALQRFSPSDIRILGLCEARSL